MFVNFLPSHCLLLKGIKSLGGVEGTATAIK